jgi:hypothetical protein
MLQRPSRKGDPRPASRQDPRRRQRQRPRHSRYRDLAHGSGCHRTAVLRATRGRQRHAVCDSGGCRFGGDGCDRDDAPEQCARRPLRRRDLQHSVHPWPGSDRGRDPPMDSRRPSPSPVASCSRTSRSSRLWRETRRRCPCESTGTLRDAGEGPASAAHSSQRQVTLRASANHRHSWTVARCC